MGEWTDHWDWWDSTKIWRYWLVPVSCVFHHTLYYLLKKYLVRKVCDPIVRKQSRSVTTNDYTNGEYKSNGHNAARPNELQSTKGEGVKRLSDADVSDISAKVVTFVTTTFTSFYSAYAMWETADDVMKSKSWLLGPATHFTLWYFVYDFYAMYDTVYLRKELWREKSLWRRLSIFVRKRGLFIVHHIALITLGYPFVVDRRTWRKDLGDFLTAAFFTRECSNPLLMMAQILKILNLHHTTFAIVNGSLTIVTFFICRIANTPLVIIYYAYQYHDGHLFSALQAMQPICFIVIILEMSMEIYWFLAIIRIGLQTLNSRATSGAVKKRSD